MRLNKLAANVHDKFLLHSYIRKNIFYNKSYNKFNTI